MGVDEEEQDAGLERLTLVQRNHTRLRRVHDNVVDSAVAALEVIDVQLATEEDDPNQCFEVGVIHSHSGGYGMSLRSMEGRKVSAQPNVALLEILGMVLPDFQGRNDSVVKMEVHCDRLSSDNSPQAESGLDVAFHKYSMVCIPDEDEDPQLRGGRVKRDSNEKMQFLDIGVDQRTDTEDAGMDDLGD